MHKKTEGLVLREVNIREADKLLTVLTRDEGKITLLARGARRRGSKLTGAAQLLAYSEMTVFEYRGRNSLDEARTIELFLGLRSELEKLALASYFAELTESVTDEDRADPQILSLVLNALYALSSLKKPPAIVKAAFELRLMCLAGYEPALDRCHDCESGQPRDAHFDVDNGVLYCGKCASEHKTGLLTPLSPGALGAAGHITGSDPKRLFSFSLGNEALKQLAAAGEAYVLAQLGRGFDTLNFYNSVKNGLVQ